MKLSKYFVEMIFFPQGSRSWLEMRKLDGFWVRFGSEKYYISRWIRIEKIRVDLGNTNFLDRVGSDYTVRVRIIFG